MRTIAALVLGLVLGSASMALASSGALTHSRFTLAKTTAELGPHQVKFVGCPDDWDLPSFTFTFVGYDPTNDRLVLRCPA